MEILRGGIYLVKLNPGNNNLKKTRPCIVIQSDLYNRVLDTTIVVPFSSKPFSNQRRPLNVPVVNNPVLDKKSYVLVHMLISVDKIRLKKYLGTIDERELKSILKQLKLVIF